MSHFRIDGPAQVGISGGRSSALMGQRIVEAYGGKLPDDVHFNFNNTGRELWQALAFVEALRLRWGVPITWIEFDGVYGSGLSWKIVTFETASRNGEPFDKVLTYYDELRKHEKNEPPILPNPVNRMCTDRMKIKASAWWMKSMGYTEWDAAIGVRFDEPKRHARLLASNGKERWDNVMPLFAAGVTQADVQAYWKSQDVDLGVDSDLGNCDLCFLKHENKLIRSIRRDPKSAIWWIAQEERTGQRFRNDRPSYRELAWIAEQKNKQLGFAGFEPSQSEEDIADCVCG